MIEEILKKQIGLSVENIGKKKIDSDVQYRMKQCGLSEFSDYEKLLGTSKEELNRLIETVTVPETWFFRLKGSFEYLEDFIKNEWMPNAAERKLRILCIPCATGEEPYSIAITLLECGMAPDDFIIEAADINSVCLEKAKNAVYTKNSFRCERDDFINRYFTKDSYLYTLDEEIKKHVKFSKQNLLEYNPEQENRYDLLFCRNMLIYLDLEDQQRAIKTLTSYMVKPGGILFLGHSESGTVFNSNFVSVKVKGCFAFRWQESAPEKIESPAVSFKAQPPLPAPKTSKAAPVIQGVKRPDPVKNDPLKTVPELKKSNETHGHAAVEQEEENLLKKAEFSANKGDLKTAEEICKAYIAENKLDFKAYFLMGIVLMSAKRYSEAEMFVRKALFLRPDYYEALSVLSLIKEHLGDTETSKGLKERAGRLKGVDV